MAVQAQSEQDVEITIPPELMPRVDQLITEDDTPVDNLFCTKQQRLLVEPLYTAWKGGSERQPFIADANVGMFAVDRNPAIVPDGFLSLDVQLPSNLWIKGHRSYFFWLYGKPPEVVIEVVSNQEGGELVSKLRDYARMRIVYYVVFDPLDQLGQGVLNSFVLERLEYRAHDTTMMPDVGLGLTLWEGAYEGHHATWLRWCDLEGRVIPTGAELSAQEAQRAEQEAQRAEQEAQRAEQEAQRAEQERQRAEQERQRAEQAEQQLERLKAQLRAAGIEPQL